MKENKKADRAKQFLPFDALKGFREALKEKEKIIVPKRNLSDELKETLSIKLLQVRKGMIVKVVYYQSDEYIELEGMVSNIDFTLRSITIVKTKIPFDDLFEITGNEIKLNEYID